MNDINALPPVQQHQLDAMQRAADKMMAQEAATNQRPVFNENPILGLNKIEVQQEQRINPVLAHHEEPQDQEVEQDIQPQETIDQEIDVQSQPSQESDYNRNMRAMREKAKQAEKERDEALRMAKKLSEMQEQYQKPVQQEPNNDYDVEDSDNLGINDDDLVEGKHLGKVAKQMRDLKKQLKQYQQQSNLASTEAKLKAQYPDFEQVLSKDNIDTFRYAYPELAATIDSTQDVYTKAVSAYTLIKKFGVYAPEVTEKERITKNISKPRAAVSITPQHGDSPISRANAFANGLTKDLQEQMFKEMQAARKGY
jgi:hypothetical protein